MNDKTTKITVLVDASQAKAEAASLNSQLSSSSDKLGSSSVVAAQGMTVLEKQIVRNKGALSVSNIEIAVARKEMAELQRKIADVATETGRNSAETLAARAAYSELANSTRLAAAEKGVVMAQTRALTGSLQTLEAGVGTTTSAWMRHTNMINTGQGPMRGYDALIQSVARSMGGIPVAAAIAIPIIVALGAAIFKANQEKKETIKLDTDQVSLDIQRNLMANTGKQWTFELARALHDLNVVKANVKNASEKLQAAQADETDAIRKSSDTYKQAAALQSDLTTKLAFHVFGLVAGVKEEKEAIATRVKAAKTLEEEIEVRVRLAAEMGQTREALVAEMRAAKVDEQAISDLNKALDAGMLARARFRAGQSLIGQTRTKVAEEAAEAGVTLTHAEAKRRFTEALKAQGDEAVRLGEVTVLTEKNLKAFNETTRSGAGASRAYANTLIDLRKRLADAKAALEDDSYAKREQQIRNAARAEAEHLVVNKRDRIAALNVLRELERVQVEKVANDRIAAEQSVMVEIARMNIERNENEIGRARDLMNLDIALREVALRREFGDTTRTAELIDLYKRAKYDEFARWYLGRRNEVIELEMKAERQMLDTLDDERQKRDKKALSDFVKAQKDRAAVLKAFSGNFTVGGGSVALDVDRMEASLGVIKELRLSQLDFDRALQATNRDLVQFERLMARTRQFRQGDWFGGLIGSIKDVGSALIESGKIAEIWSSAVAEAMEITITNGGNFISAFGKLLIGGMMQVFGQMAIVSGSVHVAQGLARMATLWDFAGGAREFAAGTALIALGAALGAAGGMLSSSARGGGSPPAGAAGPSSVSSAAPPSSSGAPRQPIVIDVPTSPQARADARRDAAERRLNQEVIAQQQARNELGPITLIVNLGNDAGKKFLDGVMDGRGVLTVENATGQHRRRLKRAFGG